MKPASHLPGVSDAAVKETENHASQKQTTRVPSRRLIFAAWIVAVALVISISFDMRGMLASPPQQPPKPPKILAASYKQRLVVEEAPSASKLTPEETQLPPPLEVLRRPSVIPVGEPEYLNELVTEQGPLLVDNDSIESYRDHLSAAANKLLALWDDSSDTVKLVYHANFCSPREEPAKPSVAVRRRAGNAKGLHEGGESEELHPQAQPSEPSSPSAGATIEDHADEGLLVSSSSEVEWEQVRLHSFEKGFDRLMAHAASALNEIHPEDLASTEGRQFVAARLLIATTVVRAALARLTLLTELERFTEETGASSVLLGRAQAPLPSAEELMQLPQDTSFEDFVIMCGHSALVSKKDVPALSQRVPKILARRLASSVIVDDMTLQSHRYVHGLFNSLLNRLKTRDLLVGELLDQFFPPSLCRSILKKLERLREAEPLDAVSLGAWAEDWSVQGVLDRIELTEEEEQARHAEWMILKPSASAQKLFFQAVNLL